MTLLNRKLPLVIETGVPGDGPWARSMVPLKPPRIHPPADPYSVMMTVLLVAVLLIARAQTDSHRPCAARAGEGPRGVAIEQQGELALGIGHDAAVGLITGRGIERVA
ncbi:MAG: hypothetical protein ACK4L7_06985 [Flavobacteriales bacterium]